MALIYKLWLGPALVGVWKITESEPELWESPALSTADRSYLHSLSHPRRRLESLAARATLAALQACAPSPHHSLSHSFPWAAAVLAPYPIAVDIERLRPFPQSVQTYFTSEPERQALLNRNQTFWHAWCAKEVAYKLLCQEFDSVSFKKELQFDGDFVVFHRGATHRILRIQFLESPEWLLAVGNFA